MSGEQVPREAKLISILLTHAGVPECEPKVIQQLSEFMFSMDPRRVRSGLIFWFRWLEYTTDILQDAIIYGEHAGKGEVDIEDIKLAIQTHTSHVFSGPPSRDVAWSLSLPP